MNDAERLIIPRCLCVQGKELAKAVQRETKLWISDKARRQHSPALRLSSFWDHQNDPSAVSIYPSGGSALPINGLAHLRGAHHLLPPVHHHPLAPHSHSGTFAQASPIPAITITSSVTNVPGLNGLDAVWDHHGFSNTELFSQQQDARTPSPPRSASSYDSTQYYAPPLGPPTTTTAAYSSMPSSSWSSAATYASSQRSFEQQSWQSYSEGTSPSTSASPTRDSSPRSLVPFY